MSLRRGRAVVVGGYGVDAVAGADGDGGHAHGLGGFLPGQGQAVVEVCHLAPQLADLFVLSG